MRKVPAGSDRIEAEQPKFSLGSRAIHTDRRMKETMVNSAQFQPGQSGHQAGFELPGLVLTQKASEAGGNTNQAAEILGSVELETSDYQEVAESLYMLAAQHVRNGLYKKAEQSLKQALLILEGVAGSDHLVIAEILSNLGTVHLLVDSYESSERCLHRAILILEAHPDTEVEVARAFNNLSAVYNKQGLFEDGEACLKEALAIMERTLLEEVGVADHKEIIPILENYADLMLKTDRARDAGAIKARIKTIRGKCGQSDAA